MDRRKKKKDQHNKQEQENPLTDHSKRIWLSIANLNIFGAGFLLAGKLKHWLPFFGGGCALVIAGQLLNASRNILLWVGMFVLYFFGQAAYLWFLLGKEPALLPAWIKKTAYLLIIAALMINILFYGGYFLYRWSGQRLDRAAQKAYENDLFNPAFGNWYAFSRYYRLSLNPRVVPAANSLGEVSLIIDSQSQLDAGQYSKAVASIDHFNILYPDSTKENAMAGVGVQAYLGWAEDLIADKQYADALEKLNAINNNFTGDTYVFSESIDSGFSHLYASWGENLLAEDEYREAVETLEKVVLQYKDSADYDKSYQHTALAYQGWAQKLIGENDYPTAAEKLEMILSSYIDADNVDEVQKMLPTAYIGWGKAMRSDGKFLEAIAKFSEAQQITGSGFDKNTADEEIIRTIEMLADDDGEDAQQVIEDARNTACDGKVPDHPAINLFEDESGKFVFCGPWTDRYTADIEAEKPGFVRYVASRTLDEQTVQTCPYEAGHTLYRVRRYTVVTVKHILTGEEIDQKTFYGSVPDACPYSRVFYGMEDTVYGGDPDQELIAEWLQEVRE